MRQLVDATILHHFLRELGTRSGASGRVYVTGGASLLLLGLRVVAIDIDLITDDDNVLRAAVSLRDELGVNVDRELPRFAPPGWQERSAFIAREGDLSFHHLDFYAQTLARLERGHVKDLADVRKLVQAGFLVKEVALEQVELVMMDRPAIKRAVESLQ